MTSPRDKARAVFVSSSQRSRSTPPRKAYIESDETSLNTRAFCQSLSLPLSSLQTLIANFFLFRSAELSTPLPPHGETSIGRAEDSVQNCLRLRPRAPRKDLKKFLQYSGKVSGSGSFCIHLIFPNKSLRKRPCSGFLIKCVN